jgi:hypothetical protein
MEDEWMSTFFCHLGIIIYHNSDLNKALRDFADGEVARPFWMAQSWIWLRGGHINGEWM